MSPMLVKNLATPPNFSQFGWAKLSRITGNDYDKAMIIKGSIA
jgi:hypothetical protein